MNYPRIAVLSALNALAIYLFVTAPAPLPEAVAVPEKSGHRIPVAAAFEAFNTINAQARRIYTERIVGGGKEAGFAFSEEWRDGDREAGPLPALFFRLVASELTKRPEPLSVFLGSDAPINPSNRFGGDQAARFAELRADGRPRVFRDSDGNHVGMFADPASAKPCVSCHNEHQASPKKDWKIDDVMGAATWIYPRSDMSVGEFAVLVRNVYQGVEGAWSAYLAKTATFAEPVRVSTGAWPSRGSRVLPDSRTFMAEVYRASAPAVMGILNEGGSAAALPILSAEALAP